MHYFVIEIQNRADGVDNVHPTEAGYQKMALEVANQINCWQNGE